MKGLERYQSYDKNQKDTNHSSNNDILSWTGKIE